MTETQTTFALTDALIFTGDVFVENQSLLVSNGKVLDIVRNSAIPDGYTPISCANQILAPGYIDCQVNGGDNVLFNDVPTTDGAIQIAKAHRKTGTTRLLPTCITDKPEIMKAAVQAARDARLVEPSVLGIHLEGPHISKEYKGAHNPLYVRTMSEGDEKLYRQESDEVFLLTLAPEEVQAEQIKRVSQNGVIVSLGHSCATQEQVKAAIKNGAKGFTHLFTRMPPITTRNAGMAAYALDEKEVYAGMIGDGIHLDHALMRLAVRVKGASDRLYLVSDAAPPAGAEAPSPYMMGGQKVTVQNGKCLNENGVVAGSSMTLGQCVATCIRDVRLDPEIVLRMASAVPAQFLGLDHRFGKLLPGYSADVVALDHSFKALSVWVNGQRVNN